MIISRYNLDLRSVTTNDLETVRTWRNKSRVRQHMQFQEEISEEQQLSWFNALDTERNVYWIFSKGGKDIGVVHIKNITDGVGEPGIFTGVDEYLLSPLPALAILVMMDIAFASLGREALTAKIQVNNHHNLWTNLRFGYEPDHKIDNSRFEYYRVEKERFRSYTAFLRPSLKKLYGDKTQVSFNGNTTGILKKVADSMVMESENSGVLQL